MTGRFEGAIGGVSIGGAALLVQMAQAAGEAASRVAIEAASQESFVALVAVMAEKCGG